MEAIIFSFHVLIAFYAKAFWQQYLRIQKGYCFKYAGDTGFPLTMGFLKPSFFCAWRDGPCRKAILTMSPHSQLSLEDAWHKKANY